MWLLKSLIAIVSVFYLSEQHAQSQTAPSFFDFMTAQYFDSGSVPLTSEILGAANPNIENSKDGLSNAAVFSGRCWDKKFYRDFSTNGALVFYKSGEKVHFYVVNVPLTSNNELAPESYFDSKMFRPWADVSESSPYPSLTPAVPYNGSLMALSYENLQGFLLRKMGDNFYTETVAIVSGQNPSLGEVQIVCNFFKRLEKIADPAVLARLAEEARQKELAKLKSEHHYNFGPPNLGGYWYYHYHYNGYMGWPIPPWYGGYPFFPLRH